jgi:hypothetical protein
MSGFDVHEHISIKTARRALTLAECAARIELHAGRPRASTSGDTVSFWFTNGRDYIVIYCIPECYLAELWAPEDGAMECFPLAIKNIRGMLRALYNASYTSFDDFFEDILNDAGDVDLRGLIE